MLPFASEAVQLNQIPLPKDDKKIFFAGYASVFDIMDDDKDVISFGAFDEAKVEEVDLLFQHELGSVLGYIAKMEEDDYGLFIEGYILLTLPYGEKVADLIKKDIFMGLSIGYLIDEYTTIKGIKYLKKVSLFEISFVTKPINPKAVILYYENQQQSSHQIYPLPKYCGQSKNATV